MRRENYFPGEDNRLVHCYLKSSSGSSLLAVVYLWALIGVQGTWVQCFHQCLYKMGSIVIWLISLVRKDGSPSNESNFLWASTCTIMNTSTLIKEVEELDLYEDSEANESVLLGSQKLSVAGVSNVRNHLPDHTIQVPGKWSVPTSEIVWLGDAWICCEQLKHYQAFRCNETGIPVHSFVFTMAYEGRRCLGYLEDLYEDMKGQKKVRVRWFYHSQEVKSLIPQLDAHPREILITPHVQVICAGYIDSLATVLTPKDYEKCSVLDSQMLPSMAGIFMCFRQFNNYEVKPFSLSNLPGYSNQAILSSLDCHLVPKHQAKGNTSRGKKKENFSQEDPTRKFPKKTRSNRAYKRLESGNPEVTNSVHGKQIGASELTCQKLNINISSKGPTGIQLVELEPHRQAFSKVGDNIELLCQDSGMRGCWFKCKVLKASEKRLKVQYNDVEDVEGSGKLEEWVPAARVAAPDKLSMRYSGRLTVRPWHPKDHSNNSFEVGAAVDAWWSDGWWEGVVTGVSLLRSDTLHIYFPGEGRFLTRHRKNLRASRDWVDNIWVEVKPKPDVLSFICSSLGHNPKLPTISTVDEASKRGDSALVANSKPKAVEEKTKEVSGSSSVANFKPKAVEEKTKGSGSAAAENVDKMSQNFKKLTLHQRH